MHHGGRAFFKPASKEVFSGGLPIDLDSPELNLFQDLEVTHLSLTDIGFLILSVVDPIVRLNRLPSELKQDSKNTKYC